MKPRNEQQTLIEAQSRGNQSRFKIEKLEERIAPKKGGVPGPPGGDDDGGGGKGRAGCRGSGCDR